MEWGHVAPEESVGLLCEPTPDQTPESVRTREHHPTPGAERRRSSTVAVDGRINDPTWAGEETVTLELNATFEMGEQ